MSGARIRNGSERLKSLHRASTPSDLILLGILIIEYISGFSAAGRLDGVAFQSPPKMQGRLFHLLRVEPIKSKKGAQLLSFGPYTDHILIYCRRHVQ